MGLTRTTRGDIDDSLLEKRVIVASDTDNERITHTEYWLGAEMVRRDVHVHLKKALFATGEPVSLGGGE